MSVPAPSPLPLTPEAYEPLCRESFTFRPEDGATVEFTLTEVKKHIDDEVQRCFSVFFQGPEPLLAQGMLHRLGHSRLGEIDLFLVPIRRVRGGFVHEAVFNLLKQPEQN